MRLIEPALASVLGSSVVLINKPGASGTLGMQAVAPAAPDELR
jgi:tripartite-type tricarboxylate transporter receptor subunit TctC